MGAVVGKNVESEPYIPFSKERAFQHEKLKMDY
jgi:hypothetical protein